MGNALSFVAQGRPVSAPLGWQGAPMASRLGWGGTRMQLSGPRVSASAIWHLPIVAIAQRKRSQANARVHVASAQPRLPVDKSPYLYATGRCLWLNLEIFEKKNHHF